MQRFLLILSFFLLHQSAFAQHTENGQVYLGIKAGYTTSSLYGRDLSLLSTGGNTSPLGGMFAEIIANTKFNTHFGLKSGLSIVQSGGTLQLQDGTASQPFRSKFKSTYLIIQPFSPALYIKGIHLYAGPYVGVLINASIERKAADGGSYADKSIFGSSTSPGGYRQKMDAGMIVGLEYEFRKSITIGASYRRGLVSVMEDARLQNQWKIYNQQFSFSIGYNFRRK